jgi:RNA polymerase sigma factor (sigma-70 family)
MNPDHFDAFYRAEYPRLVRYLIAVMGLDAAEAEDVAQDALIIMMDRLEYVRSETAHSYLFVTATRMTAKRKTERNRVIVTDHIGEAVGIGSTPDTASEITDREDVLRMMRALPPAQRAIMTLTYEGLNTAEISEALKITAATVRSNLRHARHALREQVDLEATD